MENFNFLNDRPPLTPDEVQARKNFDKLLQQYKSMPVKFYRTGWFKAGLATVTVAVTGTILFFATGPQNENGSDKKTAAVATASHTASPYADETPCVKSPTPQIDVTEKQFTIHSDRDTVLYYETGSSIRIKAHSLLAGNGNPVQGDVIIRYREFHNPVEVFASGIPMQYDSAGKPWNLQSAGMIEITAWQGNQQVAVHPEHPLTIEMKSGRPDGGFNVYYLDTAKRNWNYKGRDELMAQTSKQSNVKQSNVKQSNVKQSNVKPVVEKLDSVKIKKELQASLPMKPRHLNPKAFSFTLDVIESEFPELAVYEKNKFEVEDKNNVFDNKIYSMEWEDASLRTITAGEKYELTLTRGAIRKTFNVIPVLEGKDYTAAQEVYRKKYREYEDKLKNRLQEEKRKIEKEKAELSRWEREQAEKHRLRVQEFTASKMPDEVLARFGADNSNKTLVTRAFSVSKFGIWNCDKPADFPAGEKVMASFYDESGDVLPMTMAYLCEKDKKFVYTYSPEQFHRFTFNPSSQNIIWGIRTDGKLVYGLEDVFAAGNKKGREMVFKLKVMDQKFTSLKQVKELLNI
jgi:hypothetical protein